MTNKKTVEAKPEINLDALKKYSWGKVALDNYKNRDNAGAAYALAKFNQESGDIHDNAFMYERGLKTAVEFLSSKYQEAIGDASIGGYLSALGTKNDFGDIGKLKTSDLLDKLNDAKYIMNKKDSSPEDKQKAQDEIINYQNYLELMQSSEDVFLSSNQSQITELKRDGLVKKILEVDQQKKAA